MSIRDFKWVLKLINSRCFRITPAIWFWTLCRRSVLIPLTCILSWWSWLISCFWPVTLLASRGQRVIFIFNFFLLPLLGQMRGSGICLAFGGSSFAELPTGLFLQSGHSATCFGILNLRSAGASPAVSSSSWRVNVQGSRCCHWRAEIGTFLLRNSIWEKMTTLKLFSNFVEQSVQRIPCKVW